MSVSSPLDTAIQSELSDLSIVTDAQVKSFRVPGERRSGSDLYTAVLAVQASLGRQWISRKHLRHMALQLLREGQLS